MVGAYSLYTESGLNVIRGHFESKSKETVSIAQIDMYRVSPKASRTLFRFVDLILQASRVSSRLFLVLKTIKLTFIAIFLEF